MLELIDTKQIDPKKIIFSDEAHICLDGYINNQNFRIWGTEKPQLVVDKPLHPEKVTVWCAMTASKIIGPYFFDGMIDSKSYRAMLENFFLPKVIESGMSSEYYFQQDGAAPHVSKENLDILRGVFGDRVISRKYPEIFGSGMAWPPYSPDLSTLDFFSWGFLKDKEFREAPKTLESLRQAKVQVLESVPADSCGRTISSFEKRVRYIITVNEGYVENILS